MYRSEFERVVCEDLESRQVKFQYEPHTLSYIVPEVKRTYLPDLILSNGIVIELKGWFPLQQRQKMLHVRKSNPNLDIRIVLMKASVKIHKKSKTTLGDWCTKNKFTWAAERIPKSWIREKGKSK